MDIKEFLKEKRELETEIGIGVAKAMKTFRSVTGCSPNDICINLYQVTEIGEEAPSFYVQSVKVIVEL